MGGYEGIRMSVSERARANVHRAQDQQPVADTATRLVPPTSWSFSLVLVAVAPAVAT